MLLSIVKGCVFKQLLYNNTLRTELSSQLFIVYCIISPNKASGLLFIFIHISTGHAHFLNDIRNTHLLGAFKVQYSVFQL